MSTTIYDGIKTELGRSIPPLYFVPLNDEDPLNWKGHLDKTDTAYDKLKCLLVFVRDRD